MNKRKIRWKQGAGLLMAVTLLFSAPTAVKAEQHWPEGPEITSPSAIVIELNSGAVLYEKNADQVNYPASITKVLTTYLALEHSDLEEIVTFSDDAINLNQGDTSHIARDYGEQMTMKECLYAVMLESANECAYAVAEHVGVKLGGDYQTFIDMMNEKAKELGCTNTHFTNANGLPDENHYTSARDMALISMAAYKNEDFRIICGTRSYRIPPTNRHKEITPLNNHHNLISNYRTDDHLYEYATGGKTGYTKAAGSTLVSYAEKDGLTLVCVVMKEVGYGNFEATIELFEYCFQNFQKVEIDDNGNANDGQEDGTGDGMGYPPFVKLKENAQIVLPIAADIKDVDVSLESTDLSTDAVAQLKYSYGGHIAGCADVILSNEEIEDYYFSEQEEQDDKKVIEIKGNHILIGIGGIALLIILIIGIKCLYDNYYVILHSMEVKKQRKERFRPIASRKRKWRKRDRMFK
ncbi:MAG: D-alanyl-D-alanine carboxypeptidase [Agathobacter sp.]|nr:D-alanyl-D-alanine carboxypeptidase [Agathobacter sp.]